MTQQQRRHDDEVLLFLPPRCFSAPHSRSSSCGSDRLFSLVRACACTHSSLPLSLRPSLDSCFTWSPRTRFRQLLPARAGGNFFWPQKRTWALRPGFSRRQSRNMMMFRPFNHTGTDPVRFRALYETEYSIIFETEGLVLVSIDPLLT